MNTPRLYQTASHRLPVRWVAAGWVLPVRPAEAVRMGLSLVASRSFSASGSRRRLMAPVLPDESEILHFDI